MESKDINPKEELKEYELEVESNNFFKTIINKLKNNIKLLPSSDDAQNYKLTNRSVNYMWKLGEVKSHVVKFFENLHMLTTINKEKRVMQDNIEIQVIKENNVLENISTATKKIGIISPIIPKTKEEIKTK